MPVPVLLSLIASWLGRVARATTDVSAQWLIKARLGRDARRNLACTHWGMARIAYTLGYANLAYHAALHAGCGNVTPGFPGTGL